MDKAQADHLSPEGVKMYTNLETSQFIPTNIRNAESISEGYTNEYKFEDLTIEADLGEGSYGKVMKVYHATTG